jgi:hypothetical protein
MDNIRQYSTESCQTITSHAIITDEIYPSTDLPTDSIRWYYTVINTDGLYVSKSVGDYRWNCRRIYSVGNVPAWNFFFCARVSVGVCFFLFAIELATEMGFTDDCYTDGRVPSVRPSGIISPTDFIPVTDGISPSVKLFNGVVF